MPNTDLAPLLAEARRHLDAISQRDWRVGVHYGIHVYAGKEPLGTYLRPEYASAAVTFRNAMPTLLVELESLTAERDALRRVIKECCQCLFEHTEAGTEQYQECHLHQCQRSVRLENGDPSEVTLLEELTRLERENHTLRAEVERLKKGN